ncbi:DUF2007 domain-containing protein [Saccharicrinis sp. FJH62]|uniref:putative signal transducing protein n=1 Tax=Saccharicrinis sp. FJH62 TaxID=3344657 RepID=UPI0035D3E25F
MKNPNELVTLEVFNDSFHAHLLQSKLESEGIECHVFDENTSNLGPHYNQFVGGIKVKVREADKEKALQIYREIHNTPFTDESGTVLRCPKCHSDKIETGFGNTKGIKGFFLGLLSVALATFPFSNATYYYCKSCGNEFKGKK